jgi:hypothetical protein
VPESLQPLLAELLRKSATFRRQWAQIIAAAHVRVAVVTTAPLSGLTVTPRARTTMVHFAYGLLKARIEIPAAADHAELLAHEFEHIIEQIEGLDLAELSRTRDSGVVRKDDGMYETIRARAAGRAAAAEVYGTTDPLVRSAFGAVSRMLRGISARATSSTTARPPSLLRR